ncbi:MAG TPA: hypothetical protein VJG67_00715 [Candidatus Paceibacterota bacterium]
MINIGKLQQKANSFLVIFVFGCIIITIVLLYVMQKAEATAENLSLQSIDDY